MEVAEAPTPRSAAPRPTPTCADWEGRRPQVRVTRKAVLAMLEQCQTTLELLKHADLDAMGPEEPVEEEEEEKEERPRSGGGQLRESSPPPPSSSSSVADESETDELCELLKSRVDSPDFLVKLGSIHASVSHNLSDESVSWDIVTAADLWEDKNFDGEHDLSQGDYVLVKKEDIVDGIACFMAAYLLSLKQTKDLTPSQLQDALSKTFSVKKKKGKLRRAWDGSRVLYNVASWSATAVGIYQNPALLKAASTAIWTSCRALSKLF